MPYLGPGTYSHHTGKTYEVLGEGINKDTEEPVIIYSRKDDDGKLLLFSRSRKSFSENAFYIENSHDCEVVPKFTKAVNKELFEAHRIP